MTNKKEKRRWISRRNNDDETDEEKKEDKIEEELNTDWTQVKLTASLQLTAGCYSKHTRVYLEWQTIASICRPAPFHSFSLRCKTQQVLNQSQLQGIWIHAKMKMKWYCLHEVSNQELLPELLHVNFSMIVGKIFGLCLFCTVVQLANFSMDHVIDALAADHTHADNK